MTATCANQIAVLDPCASATSAIGAVFFVVHNVRSVVGLGDAYLRGHTIQLTGELRGIRQFVIKDTKKYEIAFERTQKRNSQRQDSARQLITYVKHN